jgi:hypothetical protein
MSGLIGDPPGNKRPFEMGNLVFRSLDNNDNKKKGGHAIIIV